MNIIVVDQRVYYDFLTYTVSDIPVYLEIHLPILLQLTMHIVYGRHKNLSYLVDTVHCQ